MLKLPGKLTDRQKRRYKVLFASLKKRRSSADDRIAEDAHHEVFAGINCLACANCCKTHSPLFTERDIERIAAHLHMKPGAFVSQYLLLDEDGDWVFHSTPCPFLDAKNYCTIYDQRPQACREYPHTNRKKLYQIEAITLKNAEICPAVTSILDTIERQISK